MRRPRYTFLHLLGRSFVSLLILEGKNRLGLGANGDGVHGVFFFGPVRGFQRVIGHMSLQELRAWQNWAAYDIFHGDNWSFEPGSGIDLAMSLSLRSSASYIIMNNLHPYCSRSCLRCHWAVTVSVVD